MTLETAKRIRKEGYVQGQDIRTFEQYELLNKEAEAVLRGGMNICEVQDDGSRKYTWIKVVPTKTDEESSLEQAMKRHQMRKRPHTNNVKQRRVPVQKQTPQLSVDTPAPPIYEEEPLEEQDPLHMLASKIKKVFRDFVKLLDEYVDE